MMGFLFSVTIPSPSVPLCVRGRYPRLRVHVSGKLLIPSNVGASRTTSRWYASVDTVDWNCFSTCLFTNPSLRQLRNMEDSAFSHSTDPDGSRLAQHCNSSKYDLALGRVLSDFFMCCTVDIANNNASLCFSGDDVASTVLEHARMTAWKEQTSGRASSFPSACCAIIRWRTSLARMY
eukprot:CAMPEP_0201619360 /NCGR_PEP_ID=MMETSP0492-20130828/41394_1 /ASSEMBLY_ACC=CAM_ASM_000837 /TAXON_ID=420259 /ORGANISM="Thalassiosira gravida, Strain GMp14c1" /LENGTH=177 /DNA_ID=CAMNT_0048088211 /DNA_START=164 /DNA_END=694 /DNA_ORIENTATION=+